MSTEAKTGTSAFNRNAAVSIADKIGRSKGK